MKLDLSPSLTRIAFRSTLSAAALLVISGAFSAASAAIITDPGTGTGVNAIDPAGDEAVDTELGDSQATLEALPGFTAVHDWTETPSDPSIGPSMEDGDDNTIAFTDPTLPDIFMDWINHTGNSQAKSKTFVVNENEDRNTSPDSHTFINVAAETNFTFAIDFGSYDAGTDTFDSSVNAVAAAGFVFSNVKDGFEGTVEFRDDADNILKTLNIADGQPNVNESRQEIFFGYDASGGSAIGSILVNVEVATGADAAFVGLDDVGFATTIIPEPAGAALVGLGGVILLSRRRRRGMPQSV